MGVGNFPEISGNFHFRKFPLKFPGLPYLPGLVQVTYKPMDQSKHWRSSSSGGSPA